MFLTFEGHDEERSGRVVDLRLKGPGFKTQ